MTLLRFASGKPHERGETPMFAVIFEVQPKKERWNDYLDLAKYLKPRLEAIDGFIDNERFESKRAKGRVLSLSTWRDEKAVVRWRTAREHHGVQEKGRFEIFEDYHLRVGEVTEDSDPPRGLAVVQQRFDETANPVAKAVSITELSPPEGNKPKIAAEHLGVQIGLGNNPDGLVDYEIFESIYNAGKLLLLITWRDAEAARRWAPVARPDFGKLRHRRVRIIRDYGMTDRNEAPQFYPEVRGRAHGVAAE
jgi:heme-degrading monooxygenase HmoA